MIFHSIHEQELLKQAEIFAKQLNFPSVVIFNGDLGSGKSTFCRRIIQTLADDFNLVVPSPTFTLVQEYETPHGVIYHFDLYRLSHPSELMELNLDESMQTGLCLIEWPQRAPNLSPTWVVNIEKDLNDTRTLSLLQNDK